MMAASTAAAPSGSPAGLCSWREHTPCQPVGRVRRDVSSSGYSPHAAWPGATSPATEVDSRHAAVVARARRTRVARRCDLGGRCNQRRTPSEGVFEVPVVCVQETTIRGATVKTGEENEGLRPWIACTTITRFVHSPCRPSFRAEVVQQIPF